MTKPKRKFIARIPRRGSVLPISLADLWPQGATGPASQDGESKTEDAE